MAAEFIRAEGDIAAAMNFRNSRLAEPFEVQVSKREPSLIRAKAEAAAKLLAWPARNGSCRSGRSSLIATCDVQKDHCLLAGGRVGLRERSKRVAIGIGSTLDEVYRQRVRAVDAVRERGRRAGHVTELVIDSGYRKDEVTEFARRDPQRVRMAKGMSTYFGPIADPKVEKASGVLVWNINTMQSKDTLDRLIGDPDPALAGVRRHLR
jgi:hypothetical protein